MVAIMGPSGSGKTTLLNIIGLIDSPTSGKYFLNNTLVSEYAPAELAKLRNKAFGFVLQDFALIERYSVAQNIKVPLAYSDVPRKQWNNKIHDVLSKLNISDMRNRLPSQISGGQRQRVAIARALVNNAHCILADEPTGSLDTDTGREIMDIFLDIKKSGTSIILVTHDPQIANMCDVVMEIQDGRISGQKYAMIQAEMKRTPQNSERKDHENLKNAFFDDCSYFGPVDDLFLL
jgi:putative ABC transport system ATP-binding protein